MTKKVMSEIFINMNRTVCRRTVRKGGFRGAYAVTVRFNAAPDEGVLNAMLDGLVADPAVAAGEIWIALDPKACRCRRRRNCAAVTRRSLAA